MRLYPAEALGSGYSREAERISYENGPVKISVRQVSETETEEGSLLKELSTKGFILLSVSIENRSPKNSLIFNPVHVALTDDAMDYKKPIDYTDLYDMAKDGEERINALKGKFYDLTETLPPGKSSSKLLIFGPLSEGVKTAELLIKEIYVGTSTLRLSFPFVMKKPMG